MPTPDGRSWLTPTDIADRILERLRKNGRIPEEGRSKVREDIAEAYEETGYRLEFKILRLTEKLKNAILAGHFGPLYVPNTVDENGERIQTPVGEIAEAFNLIYSKDFLDAHDEEGNPLQ